MMTALLSPKRIARIATMALACAATCATPAMAQSPAIRPALASQKDRSFLTTMLQESREQLRLAQVARHRAQDMIASSAASQTAREWSALRARLLPLAYAEGAPVRGTLGPSRRQVLELLGRTPAARFDRAVSARR